jgi:hypothetical protein
VSSLNVLLFFLLKEFVLSIFEEFSIFGRYLLDLESRESKVFVLDTFFPQNILMVEVLYGSQHVLAVGKWNGFLSFFISTNLFPDISKHDLLIL